MERVYVAIPLDKVNWPDALKNEVLSLFSVQRLIYLLLNRRNIGHTVDGSDLTLRRVIADKRLCLCVICLEPLANDFFRIVFAALELRSTAPVADALFLRLLEEGVVCLLYTSPSPRDS